MDGATAVNEQSFELPLELFAIIIDCLEEDPQTLYSCALVCRAWRRFAQRNLFKNLDIDTTLLAGLQRIVTLLWGSSMYCSRLQQLHLSGISCGGALLIGVLVRHLPQLRSLELSGDSLPSTHTRAHSIKQTLDSLVLGYDTFNLESTTRLLAHFSSIKHLSISVLDFDYVKPPNDEIEILHNLQITSLSLLIPDQILRAIRKLLRLTLPTITSLNILTRDLNHLRALALVVDDAAPSLQFLKLDYLRSMTSPRRSKEIWTIFKLSQCSALQSLTLAMTADILDPDLNDIDRLACTIIPHTPTTIQTITFELNRNYSFHPSIKDKIKWEKMDDALNKVPNLTRIAFKLPHTLGATFADWRACITEKLPQLHARSLLCLSMRDDYLDSSDSSRRESLLR